MIPDREDFWLGVPPTTTTTRTTSSPAAVAAAAASGVVTNQLLLQPDNNGSEYEAETRTAWKRYRYIVEAMEARGQKFNRKIMLEAMFRGNDLVYRQSNDCNS